MFRREQRVTAIRALTVVVALIAMAGCSSSKKAVTNTTAARVTTVVTTSTTAPPATAAPLVTTVAVTTTAAAGAPPTGFTKESATGPLQRGDFGPRVAAVQKRLKTVGFDPGPADGAFGEQTDKAAKAFQSSKGLGSDGIVGPQTNAALDAACKASGC